MEHEAQSKNVLITIMVNISSMFAAYDRRADSNSVMMTVATFWLHFEDIYWKPEYRTSILKERINERSTKQDRNLSFPK